MKIAFLINSLQGGGAEKVLTLLANEFINYNNYEIVIFTLGVNKPIYKLSENIKIINLTGDDDYKKSSLIKLYDFIRCPLRLRKYIKYYKINVLYSLMFRSNIINIFTSKMSNYHTILCEHAIPSKEQYNNKLNNYLIKKFYKYSSKIVSVSNSVKNDLVLNYSIEEEKIETIYNPIEIDQIKALSIEKIETDIEKFINSNYTVSFVGRIISMKNLQLVFNAILKLKQEKININFLIIGDGEYKQELLKLSKILNIQDNILFIGWQKNPYKYISKTQLFILPSLWESFGNVVIEAYTCGIAVLTSDAFALKELSEMNLNITFKNDNIDDLISKLEKLYLQRINFLIDENIIDEFKVSNIFQKYTKLTEGI